MSDVLITDCHCLNLDGPVLGHSLVLGFYWFYCLESYESLEVWAQGGGKWPLWASLLRLIAWLSFWSFSHLFHWWCENFGSFPTFKNLFNIYFPPQQPKLLPHYELKKTLVLQVVSMQHSIIVTRKMSASTLGHIEDHFPLHKTIHHPGLSSTWKAFESAFSFSSGANQCTLPNPHRHGFHHRFQERCYMSYCYAFQDGKIMWLLLHLPT